LSRKTPEAPVDRGGVIQHALRHARLIRALEFDVQQRAVGGLAHISTRLLRTTGSSTLCQSDTSSPLNGRSTLPASWRSAPFRVTSYSCMIRLPEAARDLTAASNLALSSKT